MRFLILMALVALGFCFNEKNWKKCQDSGFCRRQRAITPEITSFIVNDAPIVENSQISATMTEQKSGVSFNLVVSPLSNGLARIEVKEKNPEGYTVYDIEGIVEPEITTMKPTVGMTSEKDGYRFTWADSSLTIETHPVVLRFYSNGQELVTINSKKLLSLEHSRLTSGSGLEGAGTETFGGNTDSKKRGPEASGFDVNFPLASEILGLPEHAIDYALPSTVDKDGNAVKDPYRLYNLDVFEYELESTAALYGAIPFAIAVGKTHQAGLYWNNAAEMWIDVYPEDNGRALHWFTEAGAFDLFVFFSGSYKEVISDYTVVTGKPTLPPMFSLAYHQCRWNYRDEEDVKMVDRKFEEFNIPYDVLWLDIEHTNGKRYFTWDQDKFPHPVEMQDHIASRGRKMVTIIDPHLKVDSGFHVYNDAKAKDMLVKTKDDRNFEGHCWPGQSSYLDFLHPEVRRYWADQFSFDRYSGSTANLFTWNDMNEPSVFTGPETTMPKDNKHYGGVEHRIVHNMYGIHQQASTFLGHTLRTDDNPRPFVLSRAFFAGTQKYGAIWTGDNKAEWSHLEASVPMILSIGTAGLPFAGADVGGFFGNPDGELLARWYQAGAYQPFFRAHAHLDTKRREPWLFEEPYFSVIREAIKSRYRILPYLYNQFAESSSSGLPVLRPMWMEFDADITIQSQYMLGPSLLVAPITAQGATSKSVVFPGASSWYNFESMTLQKAVGETTTEMVAVPLQNIPVFIRGGHIVATKERVRRSSAQMLRDPLTLRIAASDGSATGQHYMDDETSRAYLDGASSWATITLNNDVISNQVTEGFTAHTMVERILISGLERIPKSAILQSSRGSFDLKVSEANGVATIRNPQSSMSEKWTVTLKY